MGELGQGLSLPLTRPGGLPPVEYKPSPKKITPMAIGIIAIAVIKRFTRYLRLSYFHGSSIFELDCMSKPLSKHFSDEELSRIVEMAWEDRTPFEAIEAQFGITEAQTIAIMRDQMKASSFRMWRARVTSRQTKHLAKRGFKKGRAYSSGHYKVNHGR